VTISELSKAKHAVELSHLSEILLAELGYHSELVEQSEEVPIPFLVTAIPQDERGRDRYLNFVFVPVPDEELQALELLQIHTLVSGRLIKARRTDVERLVGAINRKAGLGCMGIDEADNVYYKYVFAKGKYALFDPDLVSEMVQLFVYVVERFSGLVERVVTGQQSLAPALRELQGM
jgi:hypothetical protein